MKYWRYQYRSFLNGNFNIFSLDISPEWVGGNLWRMLEWLRNPESWPLHGVSDGLLLYFFRENRKKISDEDLWILLQRNDYQEEEDENFEQEIMQFWRAFIHIISSDFYLWDDVDRERFNSYFIEHSLTLKDVLELYIITWGVLEVNTYNDITRTLIYLKVWQLLGNETTGNPLRARTYNRFIIWVLDGSIENGRERLPETFWIIADRLRNATLHGAREIVSEAASKLLEAFNSLSHEQKLIVSVMSIGWALFIIRGRIFAARASGLALWLTAGAMLYFMSEWAFANETFRAQHPEYSSPDDVYSGILDELSQEHWLDVTALREARASGAIATSEERADARRQRLVDELAQDWMELAGITEYTIWTLTVRSLWENYGDRELAFFINNERHAIYYSFSHWEAIANNDSSSSFFVRNSEWEIFLAGWRQANLQHNLRYTSLRELSERISNGWEEDYVILEDAYFWYDLFLSYNLPE